MFVGRADELAFLLERIESAHNGASSCVLLRGPHGSGKSRLVEELRARCGGVAFEVLRCERGTSGKQIRHTLHSAASRGVRAVVLEDLERCGEEGLEALEPFDARGVLCIACVAGDDAALGIDQAIERLQLCGAYDVMLAPLGDAEMRKLTAQLRVNGRRLARAKVTRIIEFASGNPGLAIQLARAYATRESDSDEIPVPEVLRTRVRALLDSADPAEQCVLLVASLMEWSHDVAVLSRVARKPPRVVAGALQRAAIAGIARELDKGCFAFTSPLARQAVRAHAMPTWAAEYHLRLARLLERESDPEAVEAAARHFGDGGDPQRAAMLHERVGEKLTALADYVGAARNFRSASNLLAESPHRTRTLARLAEVLRRGGFEDDALRIYEEIAAGDSLWFDAESKARALSNIMQLSWSTGDMAKVESLGQKILAMDLPAGSDIKPSVIAKLAGFAAGAGRFAHVLRLLDQISEYSVLDIATRARIAQQRAYATLGLHGFESALPHFREALAIAAELTDQTLHVELSTNFANHLVTHGHTDEGLEMLHAAYATAGGSGCESRFHHTAGVYAAVLVRCGLLHDARAVVEGIDIRPSESGGLHSYYVAVPMLEIGSMLDDKELVDRALEIPIIELAFRSGESQRIAPVASRFAMHYWRTGEPDRARTLLQQAMKKVFNVCWNYDFAVAVAQCGDLEDVARARRLLVRDSAKEPKIGGAYVDLFDALVARRRGKHSQASQSGMRAAARFAKLKWPVFEAQALEAAGERSAALRLYQAMGSARDAMRLRAAIAPMKGSRGRAAALTQRERAVAALAVQGLTSKKIAESLGIGVRTVEYHLQGIYSKLGLRSRWQIPADLTASP